MRLLLRAPLTALWVALLCSASARAASQDVAYALIIAHNGGMDRKQAPLRYADDDGARYYELLAPRVREAVLLSVLDDETQVLHPGLAAKTRPPTRAALKEALARLNTRMAEDRARGERPVLYFIFTGHGKRGAAGEGAVSLMDGPFTRTDLFQGVLAPSQASFIHLIVDACDSYYFVHSRGALPVGPAHAEAVKGLLATRELERFPQVGVVLSTSTEQESHEWSAIRSGVFSHLVRSALTGAADVNADGRVEYSELHAFVAAASQGTEDVRGRLAAFVRPPALDRSVALTDLSTQAALSYLLVPPGVEGRLWVEDSRGLRVAEFNKERERSLVLALPPGRGYFLRTHGREAAFNFAKPGAVVDAGSLSWHETSLAARGAIQDALRDRLFSVPFGSRFYRGYVANLELPPVAPEEGPDLSP
ncbi:caspase family protein [Pyxidicoccus parkwayensis]|uniref:Caspase family protein n=1 Tax=Pyxidicoccus parkwayensis TaxID=2813578 RepID=A0ABX7NWG3_9BACT|nr:caspase family protein [Pyxidicoccus parkwaysis]QSQ21721.1 caspase family protein [Pyxidicoccus parkwaysis]